MIQSTSKLPVWNEENSNFLDSDLEEVFSESEFEDEEVLALSDRGMKISKALTNRVDTFLSDEDQVRRFIEQLEEEEYLTAEEDEDSDADFFDAGDALDNVNEDLLSTVNSGYGRIVVSQIQAENDDEFMEEICHLIAMTQPDEDGQSILADILKNSPKMTCGEECAHSSMEDIREPVVTQDLLGNLSMMQFYEATNSGENIHATQSQVLCDSSRFTANSVKMPDDQRMVRSVALVNSLPDVQEDQLAESLDVPSQCFAVSACVGSSSGDLVLDKMENIKSELILDIPKEVVLDVTEENDDNDIWSILTDNLYYLKVKSSFDSNPIKFQTPMKIPIVQTAKKKLFNAANNNIPIEEFQKEQQQLKLDRKSKQNYFERDQQYEGINATIDENFDPTRNITTTYLWTNRSGRLMEPKITTTDASWFPEGSFQISTKGETTGYLLDGTPIRVKTLVDSGATKPILNTKFYNRTKFLHQYSKFKIKARKIKVADGRMIIIDECVNMVISFGSHIFEMVVYLLDMDDNFDFVIGQKAMYELEGGPNFGTLTFHFLMRSIPLKAMKEVTIKPEQAKMYGIQMLAVPPDFKGGTGVIKLRSENQGMLPQTLKLEVDKRGRGLIKAHNDSSNTWTINAGEMMGSIDMRSLGYFHINRDTLVETLEEQCNFLTEDETCEYFCKLIEDHNDLCEAVNTKLKRRYASKEDKPDSNMATKDDPYPWLEPNDPRRTLTDQEIIERYVNLAEADLTTKEKRTLIKVIMKYRKAFSLRDEIGTCPHMEVELELKDTKPFFIRPFPIKEGEKDIIDKEMGKGCLLGILRKGMTSYSSPIMLIPRKHGGIPRIVTDFRHLNTRLVTLHPSIPLVRDAIQILGASGCEVISVIDLRDAYHTLRLSKKSQKYCGITPYYGSDTYLYQRLGMGLSVSPAVWQNFIQRVLSEIPNHRKHHLAIMDDCLVHSKKKDHLTHLIDLFKALIRNGLKISPKKCQLFRKKLVYMGHTLLIEDNMPKITPLKTRVDAILKLDPPKTLKNCKQFCGMVNFLSVFLKDLQIKLAPIYQLTRKGIPWEWTEECQQAFESIKKDLTNPPVLVMPNDKGHFVLVSDTSTVGCGATLYQKIDGQYRVVAYYSKKLPEAVRRYSISELELTGILANISAFKHILRNVNFTVFCDHSALVHIIKAKREPPTLRLQKLVEHLMDYKFSIKFLKGKEMFVTDFLSRNPDNDTDSPNEIIPIAFILKDATMEWDETRPLTKKRQRLVDRHHCSKCEDSLLVMTRSMTKSQGAEIPQMYPLKGDHKLPEVSKAGIIQPKPQQQVQPVQMPTPVQPVQPAQPVHQVQQEVQPIVNMNVNRNVLANFPSAGCITTPTLPALNPIPQGIGQPIYPAQTMVQTTLLEEKDRKELKDRREEGDTSRNKENFQDLEVIQGKGKRVILIPLEVKLVGKLPSFEIELDDQDKWMINEADKNRMSKQLLKDIKIDVDMIRRMLPKQVNLNKFLENLEHKVIHDYKIPLSVKELKAEYFNSPWFQDIYKYLRIGFCRYTGHANYTFKKSCEDYFLINDILFKLKYDNNMDEMTTVLCIPEKYVPIILHQYHDEVLSGHPGVRKLTETITRRYYFPGLHTIVRQYVISCLKCQSMKRKEKNASIHYPRIPLDYRPMMRFSMDIKHMPPSRLGFTKLLVCVCEFSNWIVGIPIADEQASTIAEALYHKVICTYGNPTTVICDEAPAFTSQLMRSYFHALNVKVLYVSPSNHGSNRSERYIRTLTEVLVKDLEGTAEDWLMYVGASCAAMNKQVSLVTKFSPYEIMYLRPSPDELDFNFDPDKTGIKVDVQRYMEVMASRREQVDRLVKEKKKVEAETQFIREMRRHPNEKMFRVGDLVLLDYEGGSVLRVPSRKLKRNWIGPLKIHQVLDNTHYIVSDWNEKLLSPKVHINRLKRCILNLQEINEKGQLNVANNVRDLFCKWEEVLQDMRKKNENSENEKERRKDLSV